MGISRLQTAANMAQSSQSTRPAQKSLTRFICRFFKSQSNPHYSLLGRVAKYGGLIAVSGIIVGVVIKLFTPNKNDKPTPQTNHEASPTPLPTGARPHTSPSSPCHLYLPF